MSQTKNLLPDEAWEEPSRDELIDLYGIDYDEDDDQDLDDNDWDEYDRFRNEQTAGPTW